MFSLLSHIPSIPTHENRNRSTHQRVLAYSIPYPLVKPRPSPPYTRRSRRLLQVPYNKPYFNFLFMYVWYVPEMPSSSSSTQPRQKMCQPTLSFKAGTGSRSAGVTPVVAFQRRRYYGCCDRCKTRPVEGGGRGARHASALQS